MKEIHRVIVIILWKAPKENMKPEHKVASIIHDKKFYNNQHKQTIKSIIIKISNNNNNSKVLQLWWNIMQVNPLYFLIKDNRLFLQLLQIIIAITLVLDAVLKDKVLLLL